MVYDGVKNGMNMARKRVTDCKGNSRVIFPRNVGNIDFESKLDLLRIEAMGIFKEYVRTKCISKGQQESNLSRTKYHQSSVLIITYH